MLVRPRFSTGDCTRTVGGQLSGVDFLSYLIMLKRKYSEPPGQKCGTFRHHGRDFKLPQVNPAELTNVKPRKFVELLVNAQPPSALLDQSLDFYINFFDKALATTAFLHSLTKVNIDKLTQPSLHQRIVQQVIVPSSFPISECLLVIHLSGKEIPIGTKTITCLLGRLCEPPENYRLVLGLC